MEVENAVDLYRKIAGETLDTIKTRLERTLNDMPLDSYVYIQGYPEHVKDGDFYFISAAKTKKRDDSLLKFSYELQLLLIRKYFLKIQYPDHRLELAFYFGKEGKRQKVKCLCKISWEKIEIKSCYGSLPDWIWPGFEDLFELMAGLIHKTIPGIVEAGRLIPKALEYPKS